MPIETMLRIYFLQQWFDLSDPAAEDALYDSESMRRFVGVDLSDDAVPDETTILRFRHLLEAHHLTEAIFARVRGRRPALSREPAWGVLARVVGDQSGAVAPARARRACVSRGEAAVALHDGAVPRVGEEHGPGVHAVRARESLSVAATVDALLRRRVSRNDQTQVGPLSAILERRPNQLKCATLIAIAC